MFRTIAHYEETGLGLPYPIILLDGAVAEIDEIHRRNKIGVAIPNMEGLVAAVAVTRALLPVALDGAEARFMRRAIGMSAKDFAGATNIDPATLSRWENNKATVGGWADKQIRMAVVIKLADRVPHLRLDPKAVVDLIILPRPDAVWPIITLRGERSLQGESGDREGLDWSNEFREAA